MDIDPSPRALAKRFEFLKGLLGDLKPAWDRLTPRMRAIATEQFDSKGASSGEKWPKLSDTYRMRKGSNDLLVYSGKLRSRLVDKGVLSRTKTTFKYGVRVPGARALFFGSRANNIKARPFITVTDDVKKVATLSVMEYLDAVIRRFILPTGRSLGNQFIRGRQ